MLILIILIAEAVLGVIALFIRYSWEASRINSEKIRKYPYKPLNLFYFYLIIAMVGAIVVCIVWAISFNLFSGDTTLLVATFIVGTLIGLIILGIEYRCLDMNLIFDLDYKLDKLINARIYKGNLDAMKLIYFGDGIMKYGTWSDCEKARECYNKALALKCGIDLQSKLNKCNSKIKSRDEYENKRKYSVSPGFSDEYLRSIDAPVRNLVDKMF